MMYEEEKHNDGSMPLLHMGLTLGGARDLLCEVPGYGHVCIPNTPGTVYLGNLTGPTHQVIHRSCNQDDLVFVPGLGYRTAKVMFRTALLPNFMSRKMDALRHTPALFAALSNSFVGACRQTGYDCLHWRSAWRNILTSLKLRERRSFWRHPRLTWVSIRL